jgi:hypothetical protein
VRSSFILIHPLGLLQIHATRPSQSNLRFSNKWSGILWQRSRFNASPITNAFGMGANVHVDPITGARVFLLRWCEWTPLAGLMTFLAEAVDLPCRKSGIRYSAPPIHQLFVRNHLPFCHSPIVYLHDLIYGNLSRISPRLIKRQQFCKRHGVLP